MRKYNSVNERLKRRYELYLREAKGQDEKSIDKVRAALVKFEECTKYKSFKRSILNRRGALRMHSRGHKMPIVNLSA